jgi:hypothetical protein
LFASAGSTGTPEDDSEAPLSSIFDDTYVEKPNTNNTTDLGGVTLDEEYLLGLLGERERERESERERERCGSQGTRCARNERCVCVMCRRRLNALLGVPEVSETDCARDAGGKGLKSAVPPLERDTPHSDRDTCPSCGVGHCDDLRDLSDLEIEIQKLIVYTERVVQSTLLLGIANQHSVSRGLWYY